MDIMKQNLNYEKYETHFFVFLQFFFQLNLSATHTLGNTG